jgi:hypothetical protein
MYGSARIDPKAKITLVLRDNPQMPWLINAGLWDNYELLVVRDGQLQD